MTSEATPAGEPRTVGGACLWLIRHPYRALVQRWNYKSALLSAAIRALLFLVINLRAGATAATAAMATEALFRFATSGFYGAMTQTFRQAEPRWFATVTALVLLPLVSHTLEFLVHRWRGTPELAASIVASVGLTMVSTAFNLFAMRRGAFVVGAASRSIRSDLQELPALLLQFVTSIRRSVWRAWA